MKAGGPLGLSIVGGSDHASHPFGINEPGVFISKVSLLLSLSLVLFRSFSFKRLHLSVALCLSRSHSLPLSHFPGFVYFTLACLC